LAAVPFHPGRRQPSNDYHIKNLTVMNEFFARMYEWFGFLPLYSHDLGDHLRGLDFACTGYFAIPWYTYTALLMILSTTIIYGLQFDLISGTRFTRRRHWGLAALTIVMTNSFIAFIMPYMVILAGSYCHRLKLSIYDCIGFGISNATWALVLFALLSTIEPIVRLIKGRSIKN
jgi:hypothetical protein